MCVPKALVSRQCLCSPKECTLFNTLIKLEMEQELRFLVHGIGKAPSIGAYRVDLVYCLCYKTKQFLDKFCINRPYCVPKARVFRPMPALTKRMHFVQGTYKIRNGIGVKILNTWNWQSSLKTSSPC